ncbi:hypothetical protein SCHPADRAFT_789088, partial [Schizopora paradoxa]
VPSSFFVAGIELLANNHAGRGGFSDVYKGVKGPTQMQEGPHDDRTLCYALKVLRPINASRGKADDLRQSLCREAFIWRMADHPYVLKFEGLRTLLL